jgi:hypothetical protein
MMEAARISETSVDIQLRTRQYIPEDSEFHTRRRENLKSHKNCIHHIGLCNVYSWLKFPKEYKMYLKYVTSQVKDVDWWLDGHPTTLSLY